MTCDSGSITPHFFRICGVFFIVLALFTISGVTVFAAGDSKFEYDRIAALGMQAQDGLLALDIKSCSALTVGEEVTTKLTCGGSWADGGFTCKGRTDDC